MKSLFELNGGTYTMQGDYRLPDVNEYGFYIADAVNAAINQNKKISFVYFDYDANKERHLKNDGQPYIFSPYSLVWNGDYYYMVGYSDKHNKIATFRVDRIVHVPKVLTEDAVEMPGDFNIAGYTKQVFQMYDSSERVKVKLKCDNDMMKVIIDRFGDDVSVEKADGKHFTVAVEVAPSPNFYGWLFGFGGKIKILMPKRIKDEYRRLVEETLE